MITIQWVKEQMAHREEQKRTTKEGMLKLYNSGYLQALKDILKELEAR